MCPSWSGQAGKQLGTGLCPCGVINKTKRGETGDKGIPVRGYLCMHSPGDGRKRGISGNYST